jgi:hypothetical protein
MRMAGLALLQISLVSVHAPLPACSAPPASLWLAAAAGVINALHCGAFFLQEYSQLEGDQSHAVNTAWSMLALMAVGYEGVDRKPLDAAASCLIRLQVQTAASVSVGVAACFLICFCLLCHLYCPVGVRGEQEWYGCLCLAQRAVVRLC